MDFLVLSTVEGLSLLISSFKFCNRLRRAARAALGVTVGVGGRVVTGVAAGVVAGVNPNGRVGATAGPNHGRAGAVPCIVGGAEPNSDVASAGVNIDPPSEGAPNGPDAVPFIVAGAEPNSDVGGAGANLDPPSRGAPNGPGAIPCVVGGVEPNSDVAGAGGNLDPPSAGAPHGPRGALPTGVGAGIGLCEALTASIYAPRAGEGPNPNPAGGFHVVPIGPNRGFANGLGGQNDVLSVSFFPSASSRRASNIVVSSLRIPGPSRAWSSFSNACKQQNVY